MLGDKGRTVSLAIIGLGNRGIGQLELLLSMPDVEIVAVCDIYEDRVEKAVQLTLQHRSRAPHGYRSYEELLENENSAEGVIIMTGWTTHSQIAVEAMRWGKYVAMEVGGASSLQECWDLVHTSEQTGMPCMLLENCCYGREEMTILNMVRQGLFGELIHCQGGYQHDLRDEICMGDINRHYRRSNFIHRNAELYPTHELGPICKYLNVNRGNRMLSLVSMASQSRGLTQWMHTHRPNDPCPDFQQGDVVTTMIKCALGQTIVLIHDCSTPRPYSRGGRVQGTRGIWMEDKGSISIEGLTPIDPESWSPETWQPLSDFYEQYEHPLWKEYAALGPRGGHGGMDYLVLRAFIEALQKGMPTPIDVYDTAAWMSITALSEQSISMGSMPMAIPDFTNGRWINPVPPLDSAFCLD